MSNQINHTEEIIHTAINAVKPENLFPKVVVLRNNTLILGKHKFDLTKYNDIYVIGAGKASAFMAKELEKLVGSLVKAGCVSTHADGIEKCKFIQIVEASHPLPDQKSIYAGEEILHIALQAKENDLVICLISGGGSSLMESLPKSISLKEYQDLTDVLIKCGAEINEINCIRSSLSLIKGGSLAKAIYPATCVSIIISDVIGDKLSTIASGPTFLETDYSIHPNEVIEKYNLSSQVSSSIIDYLNNNRRQSNKDFDKIKKKTFNIILGNNQTALNAAKIKAEELGYKTTILNTQLLGEASEVGRELGKLIKEQVNKKRKHCFLFGGETTVTVNGIGKGGRNQELVLGSLIELKNVQLKFIVASCGTDGRDGPTDAAGAYIDFNTWDKVKKLNLNPAYYLENNNSYNFFKEINQLIITGSTGTNVMDMQIILFD